jgi:DNA-binding transcriptional regulator YdaS (Cro superfamily)
LTAAIKAAGGAEALAGRLGIARRTLFLWRSNGVPAERVIAISAATGIPAAELRPDLAAAFATDVAQ